jgi:hypothetical protein
MGDIIAFVQAAAANKHPVSSIREGAKYEFQIDSTGTHDANQPNISGILQSGNSSHVSSAVCSPVTYKAEYFGFKSVSCTHPLSSPFMV